MLEADGVERRLIGSQRGAAQVKTTFDEYVTRRRYCGLVGIHATTLRRWERAGVVRPRKEPILGILTWVFSDEDVQLGRAVKALLDERSGTLSAIEAADLIRGAAKSR